MNNPGLSSTYARLSERPSIDTSSTGALPELHGSAADTRANIARQEYADFIRRFNPTVEKLAGMYGNPVLRQEGVANAGAQVRDSFARLPEQRERELDGLNIVLSGQEKASMERQDNLAQSLADVTARNRSLRAFDDRNEQIAVGTNPGRVTQGG